MIPITYKKKLKRQKRLQFEQDTSLNIGARYGLIFSTKFHSPVVQLPDYEYRWVDVQYSSKKLLRMLVRNEQRLVYLKELKERLRLYLSRGAF